MPWWGISLVGVWFADFMMHVPAWVRLLLAVVLTTGISVTAVILLRPQILRLNAEPPEDDAAGVGARAAAEGEGVGGGAEEALEGEQPADDQQGNDFGVSRLAGDATRIVATAFVFLLAFSLGQFWGNVQDARSATEAEQAAHTRAMAILDTYPQSPEREELAAALDRYARAVVEQEVPLLRDGNSAQTYHVHGETSADVSSAALAAEVAGYSQTPQWASLSTAIADLTSNGTSRIDAAPQPYVPTMVAIIALLGLTNLALTAAFQPARRGPNIFLIGVMSVITALLLFMLMEASNPFLGATGLRLSDFGG